MKDYYWRSDEDQALNAFVKTYENNADFALFVEFCQLKQKGLRKPALQKVEQFVKFCHAQDIDKQRKIVAKLLDFLSDVWAFDYVLVSQIRRYMIEILENWLKSEPNNVRLYIGLGELTHQKSYYFQGLEIDPSNLECAKQVILSKLDFVDYQLHHVSESKFVYDAGDENDGKQALKEVHDLLETYPQIDDWIKQEYQETKQLFDDWLNFRASDFENFPDWCQAHNRHYSFIPAYYYIKD